MSGKLPPIIPEVLHQSIMDGLAAAVQLDAMGLGGIPTFRTLSSNHLILIAALVHAKVVSLETLLQLASQNYGTRGAQAFESTWKTLEDIEFNLPNSLKESNVDGKRD